MKDLLFCPGKRKGDVLLTWSLTWLMTAKSAQHKHETNKITSQKLRYPAFIN